MTLSDFHPDDLLTASEAAAVLGRSVATLKAWRRRGTGPRTLRLGRSCIRYRAADLEGRKIGY